MIVSASLSYTDVFGAVESAAVLGLNVNPTLYTPAELSRRISQGNAVVTRVFQQPRIWLTGTDKKIHAQFGQSTKLP